MRQPWFTVIMPMYNRATTVERAVRSVLDQGFESVEVVVVDDASEDESIAVVEAIEDKRVRLLRHPVNRGVCPARNTAIDAARGKWLIMLDSDDTLVPGSLEMIHGRTVEAPESIGRLLFNNKLDDGSFSPQPPLTEATWGYVDWIQWTGMVGAVSDCVHVFRREVFDRVRFPDSHAFESRFHFDVARHFPAHTFSEVAGKHHDDATNRLIQEDPDHRRQRSLDQGDELAGLLQDHGKMIRRHAPVKFWNLVGQTASAFFSGGARWRGARFAIHYIAANPANLRMWGVLFSGLLGWRTLLLLQKARARFKR